MSRQSLQAVLQQFNYLGVAPSYQAMTGFTGVQWANTGREILLVNVGTTATTLTFNIGTTVLGESVTAPTAAPTTSAITPYGPFPSSFNQPSSGTNQIYIDFSSVTNVTVALLQMPGVY